MRWETYFQVDVANVFHHYSLHDRGCSEYMQAEVFCYLRAFPFRSERKTIRNYLHVIQRKVR